jgi:hypothetical protein
MDGGDVDHVAVVVDHVATVELAPHGSHSTGSATATDAA